MQELTRQELKAIIGLQIPTDLAMLYDTTSGKSNLLLADNTIIFKNVKLSIKTYAIVYNSADAHP